MSITEQFISDKKGNTIGVLIPLGEYKKMKEMLEDLKDIKAYDKAMKRKQKFTPFTEAVNRIRTKRKSKV